ncbi:hypothetical protein [Methylobacterium brachythecii]|uniref:Glycosyl transferase n=1 Tax=Methylobacterium brachythecii TaxID=1176177 RepID=A0A7W6ASB9_9HYPH|nr:hypothetical protein [Methylobacterium brachythecii]MBB3905716.1 hypothetical protein [Methylobacterium brachythecii]GLS47109.1 hypothetical protein GCM10007884_51130 [Methylobacterium brachythecii]
MISALIHVPRPADPEEVERLADTLSALVEGVAAGLVADALIVSAQAASALETIADGSGATLVVNGSDNPWRAAAQGARRDWLLCLEAGDLPREGWIRSVDRFVGTARPEIALGRLHRSHVALGDRFGALVDGLIGSVTPRPGDVVRRASLLGGPRFSPRQRPKALSAWVDRA